MTDQCDCGCPLCDPEGFQESDWTCFRCGAPVKVKDADIRFFRDPSRKWGSDRTVEPCHAVCP